VNQRTRVRATEEKTMGSNDDLLRCDDCGAMVAQPHTCPVATRRLATSMRADPDVHELSIILLESSWEAAASEERSEDTSVKDELLRAFEGTKLS
jgi:hypothetical protein